MPHRLRRLRRFALPLTLGAALAGAALPALAQPIDMIPARQFFPGVAGNYLAGIFAQTDGEPGLAATYFSRALLDDPANLNLIEATMMLWLEDGDVAQALPYARRLIEIAPTHEPSRLALAASAFRTGNFTGALGHVEAIEGDLVAELTKSLLKAWAQVGLGDVDAALATLAERQDAPWSLPYRNYHAALIADLAGRAVDAVGYMQAAIGSDRSLRPTEAFARILARAGEPDQALVWLGAYLEAFPSERLLTGLRDQMAAGVALDPVVASAAEGAAEALFSVAIAFANDAPMRLAVPYLQMSRYVGPATPLVTVSAAELLQEAGRHRAAVALFNQIDDQSPLRLAAVMRAALSLQALDRPEEASARLAPYVEEDPGNVQAAVTLATLYRIAEDWENMEMVAGRAIEASGGDRPDHWRLFYFRGIAREQLDRFDEAEADFLAALELEPEQSDVLNYLGYLWVDRGENLDEGLGMIARAVEQRPRNGYIVDSLGWAHYQLGNYEEAVRQLERAVTLQPDHPALFDHLGDAYWRVGRHREAMFAWGHALDFDPEPEVRAAVEEKLRSGLPDAPAE